MTPKNAVLFSVALSAAILVTSSSAFAGVQAPDERKLAVPSQFPALVALESAPDSESGCTGFFITAQIVMTAAHCDVGEGARFKVAAPKLDLRFHGDFRIPSDSDWDGTVTPIEVGHEAGLDPNGGYLPDTVDYALLQISWFPNHEREITPMKLAQSLPPIGTPLELVGYPIDLNGVMTLSFGKLLSQSYLCYGPSGPDFIVYDASQAHGNSGGPVIDLDSNEVIGIVTQSLVNHVQDWMRGILRDQSMGTSITKIRSRSDLMKKLGL